MINLEVHSRHEDLVLEKMSLYPINLRALRALDMHKKWSNSSFSPNEANAKPSGINTITDNKEFHSQSKKVSFLENECSELQHKISIFEERIKFVVGNYVTEAEKNEQLSAVLRQKEIELNENKNLLSHARAELTQSRSEVSSLQNKNEKLSEDLRVQRNIVSKENEQKIMLGNKVETLRKREKNLQEELKKTKKRIQTSHADLKKYCEGQCKVFIENQLKQFQGLLDFANSRFKEDINDLEITIAKIAVIHFQQISQLPDILTFRHSSEIKLLEEKYDEETQLFKTQIMQHRREIVNLQNKLDESTREKKCAIKKIHEVPMEGGFENFFKPQKPCTNARHRPIECFKNAVLSKFARSFVTAFEL